MQDERLIKQIVFGIMGGQNKRGRPKRKWTDDPVDWCNKNIGNLYGLAMEKFREDTHTSPEVIEAHTLNFKPTYKFSRLFFGSLARIKI